MEKVDLVFDGRHLEYEYTGLAKYSYSLLMALLSDADKNVVVIFPAQVFDDTISKDSMLYKVAKAVEGNVNAKIVSTSIRLFSIKNYLFFYRFVRQFKPERYFYPHFDLPFFIGCQSIFVVHDLFPLVVDSYITKFRWVKKAVFFLLCVASLVRKSAICICVSESTKRDILECFSFLKRKNLKVVHSASALEVEGGPIRSGHFNNGKAYLLYVGDRRPHKNIPLMLDIFEILKREYKLELDFLIVGSKKNYLDDVESLASNIPDVRIVGNVNEEDLVRAYRDSEALFFISKYEGFGLPILEAARFEKRIITSLGSSMVEIAPPGALLLDLNKRKVQLAAEVDAYLRAAVEINYSEHLSRFSWSKTASRIFSITNGEVV